MLESNDKPRTAMSGRLFMTREEVMRVMGIETNQYRLLQPHLPRLRLPGKQSRYPADHIRGFGVLYDDRGGDAGLARIPDLHAEYMTDNDARLGLAATKRQLDELVMRKSEEWALTGDRVIAVQSLVGILCVSRAYFSRYARQGVFDGLGYSPWAYDGIATVSAPLACEYFKIVESVAGG